MSSLTNLLVHAFTTQQDRSAAIEQELISFEFHKRWGQFNSSILDGVMQLDEKKMEFTNWCKDIRSTLCTIGLMRAPTFNTKDLQAKIAHIADDLVF